MLNHAFIWVLTFIGSTAVYALDNTATVTPFQVTLGTVVNKYPKMDIATEILRYNRCYSHMARSVVPKNDERLQLIKTKAVTGSEACLHLLESAKLDDNGFVRKNNNGTFVTEAKAVFKTMNDFHRSWFPTYDFKSAVPDGDFLAIGNYTMFYNGETALHLTNALLGKNIPYSSIVTNSESFEAIRDDKSNGTMTIFNTPTSTQLSGLVCSDGNRGCGEVKFTPRYVTTGDIIGLKPLASELLPNSIEMRLSSGGGVLGTVPYLLLNSGRDHFETMNGGVKQHRRWSKAVFSDLFCRDIPVVRSADAVSRVQASSNIPFRKGISCMQCHSSIDPLAQIQRNRSYDYSTSFPVNQGSVSYIKNHVVDQPQETVAQVEADDMFHKRPALGSFYFRTHDGKLLNQSVIGIEEMGDYIATVDDLYICAAKRYFQFFTGIDVPMFDSGDFSAPKLSVKQSNYRKMVIEMGLELKKNQNLEILVNKIISSQAYITPGIGEK